MRKLLVCIAISAALLVSGCTGIPVGGTWGAVATPSVESTAVQSISAEATLPPASVEPSAPPAVRLPVFVYHHVKPTADNFIAITPAMFESHLGMLERDGYTLITVTELSAHLASGTALPPKPAMITFDDGWANQYDYALPLLEKHGVKATFFLYPKVLGGGSFMKKSEVADLVAKGHDVQNHTWAHTALKSKSGETTAALTARIGDMLEPAADWLGDAVGSRPVALAYPYGHYDSRSPWVLPSLGINVAFTVDDGMNEIGLTSPLLLKRFTVFKKDTLIDFEAQLGSRPLLADEFAPGNGAVVQGPTVKLSAVVPYSEADVQSLCFVVDTERVGTRVTDAGGVRTVTAVCELEDGFHYVTLMGMATDGTRAYASWGVNTW